MSFYYSRNWLVFFFTYFLRIKINLRTYKKINVFLKSNTIREELIMRDW